jgi:transglutaminase-like putative cysteine protease
MTGRRLSLVLALARIVPVLALVLLHGLAIGRIGLAVLAVLATVAARLRGFRPELARPAEILVGVIGAILGGLALLLSPTPPGPLPPVVLSPLCGALTLLSCALVLADRLTPAWTAALLLLVAATSSPPVQPILVPGLLTLALVLCCIFLCAHAASLTAVRAGAFAAYVVVVGLSTAGITRMMTASEGVLLPLFEALLEADVFGTGLGLQAMVPLAPYSTATLSDRVILEIDGAVPSHLRGQVMDVFDGETWTASEAIQRTVEPPPPPGESQSMTLTVFTGLRGSLPAPAGTATRDSRVPAFTAGWLVQGEALRGDEIVLTVDRAGLLPGEPPPEADQRALPEDLAAALRPLTRTIIGDADTAAEQAEAIAAHFQAEHTYSLTSDLRGDDHPLVVLIRDRKPAYCVYFASAMAAMMRSIGVDARLVGGFVALETNPLTGRTMVRKRDAHAWVEIWLPEEGRWRTFDPTPSREAVLQVEEPGALRAVQDFLIRLMVRAASHPDAVLRELLLSPPVLVAIVLGGLWSLRQRLRGTGGGRGRAGPARTDPALWPLYQRYLKALSARGIVPDPAESDAELLARLALAAPELSEAAEAFVADYRRARYGGGATDLESALRRLEG